MQGYHNCEPTCGLGLGLGQAELAWKPSCMLENQNAYGSAGLGRNIHWQVLGLGTSHVRLNCNTHWQAPDPGLGAGLEREVWARPSWLQSPPVGMRARVR